MERDSQLVPDYVVNVMDSWDTECNVMEDVDINKSQFQLKCDVISQLQKATKPKGDYEPYEMTLGKKETKKVIEDYKQACEDAIHQYDVLCEILDAAVEKEREEAEKEEDLANRCKEYEGLISSNNATLDEENHKR